MWNVRYITLRTLRRKQEHMKEIILKELGSITRTVDHDHSLTIDDVRSWDYDTRRIIAEATRPCTTARIVGRMDSPMKALHGIVEKLYADNKNNKDISKLRYAYQGLAIALGRQLDTVYATLCIIGYSI